MRTVILLGIMTILAACAMEQSSSYHRVQSVPIAGEGGWDYVSVDSVARRVYVAHSTKVDVLDADSGEVVGVVAPLDGAHGVVMATGTGRGFASNGKANKVTVFDLKTLAITGTIATGNKPDAMLYDPATKRVFAFNGESGSATVIDAVRAKKIATMALKGQPEFAVADGRGHVFVNLEDKSETLAIDSRRLKVVKRWALAPCESPASLALDRTNHRLFVGCANHMLAVVNADNGEVITTLPVGEHVDATAFDASTHAVISSAADGTLTVIAQDDANHYHVAQTVTTPLRSKTFGLDEKTDRLFVPAADFGAAPPASADNPKGRPAVLPGTFTMQILEQ